MNTNETPIDKVVKMDRKIHALVKKQAKKSKLTIKDLTAIAIKFYMAHIK